MIDGSIGQVQCECGECNDIVSMEEYEILFDLKEKYYTTFLTFIQQKKHTPKDDYVWLEECGELVLIREEGE